MWPRKTLDIGFVDLLRGLSFTFTSPARSENSNLDRRLICLSVRSGFDTLLRSLKFPPGSEILFSELTIPDMGRIASCNDLKPVGVGLDPETWSVDLSLLEDSITSKTRAIVVAHLFGRRDSLREISEIARRHKLLLFEDCAQSFRDKDDAGDYLADVSMFSFGPIKTNTCLAGATFHFRSRQLADTFAQQHEQLPQQSNRSFAKRLIRFSILKCVNRPIAYGILYRAMLLFGCDPDVTISGLARGFQGSDFLNRIRKRPSVALIRLIESRLKSFDRQRLARRSLLGRKLTSLLLPSIQTPAHSGSEADGYWVYPVLSCHPESLKLELVQNGFDATERSSLEVITNDSESRTAGADFLDRVVFLPLENGMSQTDIRRLAEIVNSHEQNWRTENVDQSAAAYAALAD